MEVLENHGDVALRDVVSGDDGNGLPVGLHDLSVLLCFFSNLYDSLIILWFFRSAGPAVAQPQWQSTSGLERKKLQVRPNILFGESSPWEVAPVPQCQMFLSSTRKGTSQQERRWSSPTACLAPEHLCFSQKQAFSSCQAKNLQVSLPNL